MARDQRSLSLLRLNHSILSMAKSCRLPVTEALHDHHPLPPIFANTHGIRISCINRKFVIRSSRAMCLYHVQKALHHTQFIQRCFLQIAVQPPKYYHPNSKCIFKLHQPKIKFCAIRNDMHKLLVL